MGGDAAPGMVIGGAALAHELSRAGADLILSARNEEALHALAESLPGQAEVVPIDVRGYGQR